MSLPFPYGPYKIVNFENGDINTSPTKPVPIPVVAASEPAIWEVTPTGPVNLDFNVHHLVHILKGGQPANLEQKQKDLGQSDKGIVAIYTDATPNVWCLHKVIDNIYLIYFSRSGTIHHGPYHWHLESSKAGTNVIVNIDEDHPINKALRAHITAGLQGSLDDLTQKLKELQKHHPDCFWYFNKQN